MKSISFSHNKYGYKILVWENGRCIEEYRAGNHRLDSVQQTDDPRWIVPTDKLKKYACHTAKGMAVEHGVTDNMIEDEGYVEDVDR